MDYSSKINDSIKSVKPSGIRKFFDMLSDMDDVVALTVGQPDFVTPWHIREAAIDSLEKGKTYYTSNAGTLELRKEISNYMNRRFDLHYDPAKEVVVTAGGCTAKLGMNGKDHVKKGMPIPEDMIGGFAVVLTADDGVSPEVNLQIVGRHTVGTGSAPQAVIGSLVTEPLERVGLKVTDIDKFSPEMQNPDITKPAGAGDVPQSNYKMIAALGVKRGDLEKKDLATFIVDHGMKGWAPTQGHIPSGVPFMGPCRDMMLDGQIERAMVIGKGSLFLGRMTNLFDGVSFVIEANNGQSAGGSGVSEEEVKGLIANALKDFAAGLLAE